MSPDPGKRLSAVPSNPALDRLGILVGEWEVTLSNLSHLNDRSATIHGHTTFEWLEGGRFLLERSGVAASEFPQSTAVIGPDDAAAAYCMLYFDSRGVSRLYQMSLTGREWKLWREFPAFSQRFRGTISEDAVTIHASWEKSTDGSHWEHDFDLLYEKAG